MSPTLLALLAVLQGMALLVLLVRLLPGVRRAPPDAPLPEGVGDTTVTVLVPTLNEARRLGPCLESLMRQGEPLSEVIVVDSHSSDGTVELVRGASGRDARIRLAADPPLPAGWVGKVWALQYGLGLTRGEWILGVDADVELEPGAIAGALFAARRHRLDVVSFGPRFAGQSAGEQWIQPALLVTLVYRTGVPGPVPPPERLLANGQFFLARREALLDHGGYAAARGSFADDVTLARHLARAGLRVGFLDGSRLYRVRAYRSLAEMWREWGRSIDLSDATTAWRQWRDVAFLLLVQALPVPMAVAFATGAIATHGLAARVLLGVNAILLLLRLALVLALVGSYEERGIGYWLSWLADPLAVWRIVLSTIRRPAAWRGRRYDFSPS